MRYAVSSLFLTILSCSAGCSAPSPSTAYEPTIFQRTIVSFAADGSQSVRKTQITEEQQARENAASFRSIGQLALAQQFEQRAADLASERVRNGVEVVQEAAVTADGSCGTSSFHIYDSLLYFGNELCLIGTAGDISSTFSTYGWTSSSIGSVFNYDNDTVQLRKWNGIFWASCQAWDPSTGSDGYVGDNQALTSCSQGAGDAHWLVP